MLFMTMSLPCVVLPHPILAQDPQATGPVDARELEEFLDAFLAEWMQEYHVLGLAFVLVKDGKTFFAKGYGYSDWLWCMAPIRKRILRSPSGRHATL